jgi:DNA-binding LytR/AlgR family response regulator
LSGIDAAKHIGRRSHVVFVTAYDDYAVEAFATGALDYLLKPVEEERLVITLTRLRERLAAARPAVNTEALLQQLAAEIAQLQTRIGSGPLRWIRAQVGSTVHLIAVDDIDYIRSDAKYTTIAWRGDGGQPREAVIRTPLKDLLRQLDPEKFAQVHRSIIVNLRSIKHVRRQENETAEIHLKGRPEPLAVSRTYLYHFRQM